MAPRIFTVTGGKGWGYEVNAVCPSTPVGVVAPSPVPNKITMLFRLAGFAAELTELSWFRIAPCPLPLEFDENNPNWPTPADGNVNMVNVLGTRYNPALSQIIARANRSQGLVLDHKMDTVDPDSLWSRSDHFWMATLHIPQVEFQTGLHPDYHTDNDTWQRINYDKLTRIARLVFLSVEDLANSGEKVAFLPAGASQPSDPNKDR